MNLKLRTNLDLHRSDEVEMGRLSEILSANNIIPRVGESVILKNSPLLKLCVDAVSYDADGVVVELHLPKHWKTLTEFYQWYAPRHGQTAGAYI